MRSKVLFTDVGGVLLSNGWDSALRHRAADHFAISLDDMQSRHQMVFEDYERGKLLLAEYLQHVVFYRPRGFTITEFTDYLLNGSIAHFEMIALYRDLKTRFHLQIAALSNEGREIAASRFERFEFDSFIDFYIVSGFVGVRKPDLRIFQLALGLCQRPAEQVIYIDDRKALVEIAAGLGMQVIHHQDYPTTKAILEKLLKNTL